MKHKLNSPAKEGSVELVAANPLQASAKANTPRVLHFLIWMNFNLIGHAFEARRLRLLGDCVIPNTVSVLKGICVHVPNVTTSLARPWIIMLRF